MNVARRARLAPTPCHGECCDHVDRQEELGNVWMGSVRMSRSGTVDTTLERAWSLLASPAAYSLEGTFGFVFELPVRPSAGGRLFFTVGSSGGRGTGHIFEVVDETPQQRVRLLGRSAQHVGRHSVSAAMSPSRRGVRLELGMEVPCPRSDKIDYQMRVAKDLNAWLSAVTAVLEDRSPWPPAELPDDLRQAIGTAPAMKLPLTASESVYIEARPPLVWQAASSHEATRMSQQALYAGLLPGPSSTDTGRAGYVVVDRPQSGLVGVVSVVTEIEEGRMRATLTKGFGARTSRLEVMPAGPGSTLKITVTEAGPQGQSERDKWQAARAANLTARLGRYKALIDGPELLD